MRRILPLAALVALSAVPSFAQQATYNTPVPRPDEHHLRIEAMYSTRDAGGRWEIQVSVRDLSDNVEIRRLVFVGPDAAHPAATALAFVNARQTARSGETGGNVRHEDFRMLGFLSDNSYLTGLPAVTLAP